MKQLFTFLMIFGLLVSFSGCENADKDKKDGDKKAENHDGDHGHDHDHGPNNQPLLTFKKMDLHAELVTSKSSDKVGVEFCDHDKKPLAVKLDSIKIVYAGKEFELKAVDAKEGKAIRYESDAEELSTIARNKPDIVITQGDKSDTVKKAGVH